MGIINNDSIDSPYGTSVSGSYMALGPNTISIGIEPNEDLTGNIYKLNATASVWVDKSARDTQKRCISCMHVNKVLSSDDMSRGPYELAYAELKVRFTNTIDA